jgi:hypothetical protein
MLFGSDGSSVKSLHTGLSSGDGLLSILLGLFVDLIVLLLGLGLDFLDFLKGFVMDNEFFLSDLLDMSNGSLDGELLFLLGSLVDSGGDLIGLLRSLGGVDGLHVGLDRLLGLGFLGSNGDLEGSSGSFLDGSLSGLIKFFVFLGDMNSFNCVQKNCY